MSIMTKPPGQGFSKADLLRMFPTFVWKAELRPEIHQPINESILRTLGELGAPLADLKPGESWQSGHGLHELEGFRALADFIGRSAESVLQYLKVGDGSLAITGCWANVNAPGAGHRVHSHPNNYLSGVYYVQTPPGAGTINFLDPRPQTAIIRPPVTALTAENTEQVVIDVAAGMLLMFPAWLPHSVDPNRSDRLRISLGFNLMFTVHAERLARPLWTEGRRP